MPPSSHSFASSLRRLVPFFRPSSRGIALALAGSVFAALTEPLIPWFMKQLLDRGFQAGQMPLWQVPVFVIGLFALRGLAGFLAQYGLSWAASRAMVALREKLFGRLLDASPSLFARQTASSLINSLTYEVQTGATLLTSASLSVVQDVLKLFALLGYLLWLNWKLTVFAFILFPAVAALMRALSSRLHRLTVELQLATDELAYVVEENVLAWRIVRLHSAQTSESARFARISEALRRLGMKATVANSTMTPLTQLMAACALSVVIVIALWQSGQGTASVGSFVAFVMAMLQLVTPIKHLSDASGQITRGIAALERSVDLAELTPVESGGTYDPAQCRGRIELRGVSLRYAGAAFDALDGVDLIIEPGETVALVGPSGAGKSSLVNLLARFIEPADGQVLLDGHRLQDWDVRSLRRRFALVSQDVILFNDSIASNVALGERPDAQRVREALRGANLLDFVESLPMGIEAPVGHNGSHLSGGQRQRVAIARAIYKDAAILILDEATSALDSESERQVQDALERLMRGRTSVVIAHRLSTIERADRIVVLDAGRVVEQGAHAQLVASGGLYARLHALQFRAAA